MKLILINGPCGIGKSTLALKVHKSIPLSYLLDLDAHTRNISHYREYHAERWELSTVIARGIIEATLSVGRDVVLDKMIYEPLVIDSFYKIAKKYNANVYEIILWAPKDEVMKRADERGWKKGGLLTPEKCERFWNEIDKLKEGRPLSKLINVSGLNEGDVLNKVLGLLK